MLLDHDAADLVAACRDGSLDRDAWTHEAHLAVAWSVLHDLGDPEMALGELRGLITAYNARSGLPDDRVLCHETITRYFLDAVLAIDAASPEALLTHPWCDRRAPLRHWTSEALASDRARRSWIEPDLAPLPWTATTTTRRNQR